ncbi:metallophosphoesterase [Caminibacter pacificus]|uniref:Calcineurin-like phosphoesterase family protein n=1 Tax=Caminibacter pacificus TaxID=1424653 RepID=A0AAJ4UXU7_9BACT|nr:metallophosphoesterase [Caminibacter pacificus]QCI27787.1 protein phosphatase [Caminibacter pacificus]ROR40038.1 calcineurin-like phosphoesterase family protein [Caminibacter pacificus]
MYYVIYGDVHGCLEEWEELRKLIPKNSFEISVGDILDKGPYPVEALRYAKKNKIFTIMGNHEYKHLRKYWGRKVILDEDQQRVYPQLKQEDFDFIESMPFFLKLNHLTILHGGITNKIRLNNPPLNIMTLLLFLREVDENDKFLPLNHNHPNASFWADRYDGHEGFIVYGHNPFKDVKKNKFAAGIDTACVYGNKLTALVIKNTLKPWDYEIIQVNAKKQYSPLHFEIQNP